MKYPTILFVVTISLSAFAFAAANEGAPNLCPKFRCEAMHTQWGGGDDGGAAMSPGFGYDDVLATAQQKALLDCNNNSYNDCALSSCEKFTGPVIKIFNCQSQWN